MELDLEGRLADRTYPIPASLVVPRPIALVTTISPEGKVNAAPFSFFSVLGAGPPVLAMAPGDRHDGTPKDTARNIRLRHEFVVNLKASRILVLALWASAMAFPFGAQGAAAPAGAWKISTVRIAQLTGGYDPEGKPFLNDTVPWRVAGVDLGANAEHNGRLYFFFGDVVPTPGASWPPYDSDLIAYTEDKNPEPNGFRLTPVTHDGVFYPFTVHLPGRPSVGIQLLQNDTPTGAFSYGGKAYVFLAWHDRSKPGQPFHSSIASSTDPSRPVPFEWIAHLSPRFSQVAPWVITNSEVAGLPSTNGEGLILFGQGATPDGQGAVSLAWIPLQPVLGPDLSGIRYYTQASEPSRRWTTNATDATQLFKTRWFWSSLSVGRIPETGRWILLYQRTARPQALEESIVARLASSPWDFLDPTEAGEIPIFTPAKDGAYRVAAGDGTVLNRGYMHRESSTVADGLDHLPPTIGGAGFAYGAYLLNRYTRWDAASRSVTLYYLMSTATPYQVQLMRSQLRIPD
jgi:hypothetical protein